MKKHFQKTRARGKKKHFKIENSWEKQSCQTQSLFVTQKGEQ